MSDTPAVEFEHVALAFDDAEVLRDVSFRIPAGRMAILMGPSGSGKSLVLKMILGLVRPGCRRHPCAWHPHRHTVGAGDDGGA